MTGKTSSHFTISFTPMISPAHCIKPNWGWFLLCIEPIKLRRISVSPCKALLQPLNKGSGMPREGGSILTHLSFLISNSKSICISICLHLRDWGQSSSITGFTARVDMGVYPQLIKTKSQIGFYRFFALLKTAALIQPCFEAQDMFGAWKGFTDRE